MAAEQKSKIKVNFDYVALSNRLRQEYYVKHIEWESIEQNITTFNQIDKALIEGLLLEKHYSQILEYESSIIQFVTSDEYVFAFPTNMHSFSRLLQHRLSDMYKLESRVELVNLENGSNIENIEEKNENKNKKKKKQRKKNHFENRAVMLYKTKNTKLANIRLSEIDTIRLYQFYESQLNENEVQKWKIKLNKYVLRDKQSN